MKPTTRHLARKRPHLYSLVLINLVPGSFPIPEIPFPAFYGEFNIFALYESNIEHTYCPKGGGGAFDSANVYDTQWQLGVISNWIEACVNSR